MARTATVHVVSPPRSWTGMKPWMDPEEEAAREDAGSSPDS